MRQRMYADAKPFRLSHRLRCALIYVTKVFTLMPERVVTTRPVRHPPVIVASSGRLGSEREPSIGVLLADPVFGEPSIGVLLADPVFGEPSIGVLLADPVCDAKIAMFSVIPKRLQSARREEGIEHFAAEIELAAVTTGVAPRTCMDATPRCCLVR